MAEDLFKLIDGIVTKDDFADFVAKLSWDFTTNKAVWRNQKIDIYFDGVEEFLRTIDQSSLDAMVLSLPTQSAWKFFALMLIAARHEV